MVRNARSQTTEIAPSDAAQAHNDGELALVVDVREPGEYKESHVPGAVNIPRGLLELRADPNSPGADAVPTQRRPVLARILVYCTKGLRARSCSPRRR